MKFRIIALAVVGALNVAGCAAAERDAPTDPGTRTRSLAEVLPLSEDDLNQAIAVAERFASAYLSWRFDLAPQAYVAALAPVATSDLATRLAKSASTPELLLRRTDAQEVAIARGFVRTLRAVDARAAMFTVEVEQAVTTDVSRTYRFEYVVWTAKTDRWRVTDLSPLSKSDRDELWVAD